MDLGISIGPRQKALAFGSLLTEKVFQLGYLGQDSGRGTFSQRHAVLRNQDSQ